MTELSGMVHAVDAEGRASRRFVRGCATALVAGLALSATLAWYVDPLHTFGTGRLGSFLTVEFDRKPEAFLRLDPPPEAVVLGTSRVMKMNPRCVTELTGYPAFNFGLTSSRAEDWAAAYRFVRAHSRRPLRRLLVGVDVEGFDNHADTEPRLLSSAYLRPYLDDSWRMSWGVAVRALFGWQAFKYSMLLSWYELHPSSRPRPKMTLDDRGFAIYDWEHLERQGKAVRAEAHDAMAKRLRGALAGRGFDALSVPRVALFQDMVRSAHAEGTVIDVFVPPLPPASMALRSAQIAARSRELEAMLGELDREGAIRLHPIRGLDDFHGDPAAYFDGLHMTEDNHIRLLLALFHREHGCGR